MGGPRGEGSAALRSRPPSRFRCSFGSEGAKLPRFISPLSCTAALWPSRI